MPQQVDAHVSGAAVVEEPDVPHQGARAARPLGRRLRIAVVPAAPLIFFPGAAVGPPAWTYQGEGRLVVMASGVVGVPDTPGCVRASPSLFAVEPRSAFC